MFMFTKTIEQVKDWSRYGHLSDWYWLQYQWKPFEGAYWVSNFSLWHQVRFPPKLILYCCAFGFPLELDSRSDLMVDLEFRWHTPHDHFAIKLRISRCSAVQGAANGRISVEVLFLRPLTARFVLIEHGSVARLHILALLSRGHSWCRSCECVTSSMHAATYSNSTKPDGALPRNRLWFWQNLIHRWHEHWWAYVISCESFVQIGTFKLKLKFGKCLCRRGRLHYSIQKLTGVVEDF